MDIFQFGGTIRNIENLHTVEPVLSGLFVFSSICIERSFVKRNQSNKTKNNLSSKILACFIAFKNTRHYPWMTALYRSELWWNISFNIKINESLKRSVDQSALWANSWIDTWITWFLGLCLMLSGLGNFVIDCHI